MGHGGLTVEARSLYRAVGLAIVLFRASEVHCDPSDAVKFVVQPRETLPEHTVSRQQFDAWLAKDGVASPAETFQRATIRELLNETERPVEPRRRKPYH